MEHLYVGIDCGKKLSELFGFTDQGEVVVTGALGMYDLEPWRKKFSVLRSQYQLHVAFEVGPHYDWLYDLLTEYCAEVVVVNPANFALISHSQRKTDRIDAQLLAEGVRRGDLPAVHVPDKQTRADRRLVAFVHWHGQQLGAVKTKLRSLLQQHRLECPFTNILGKGGRRWLGEKMPEFDPQAQVFVKLLVEQAEWLVKQRCELDQRVEARAATYAQAKVLQTIPGFGPLVILATLSAIAGIPRFARPERLSSYFGVCGSVYQSGQTLRLGSLTKRGNVHVRWLLSQALHHLHRKDPRARRRYQRLRRKKPCGVARGAQVRWLTEIIWHMLTKNEAYRLGGKAKLAA